MNFMVGVLVEIEPLPVPRVLPVVGGVAAGTSLLYYCQEGVMFETVLGFG
jgi:hypothetical protein